MSPSLVSNNATALNNRRIAIPESRQLDLFADMLEQRGAQVLRCPLVAIHDNPDTAPIETWLNDCLAGQLDDLILLTGEGLRRLLTFAEARNQRDAFVAAIAKTRLITRGPKPERELRKLGLKSEIKASTPTTAGVIESLKQLDGFSNRRVGVQLYGAPNPELMDYLEQEGNQTFPVSPYVYADDTETQAVTDLIHTLINREVDAIAFTSSPQIRRLFSVAKSQQLETQLTKALSQITVASVGPIVTEALEQRGIPAVIQPETSFFMKPLVNRLIRTLGASPTDSV